MPIVRPATQADLPALERHLHLWGPPDYHAQRLADQERGVGPWLIAWDGHLPVGHLQLVWRGPLQPEVRSRVGECPQFEAIGVVPEWRSRGVGSRLISAAEGLVFLRGVGRCGLSVSVANTRARDLYVRLGYKHWGYGTYLLSWDEYDAEGRATPVSETCSFYLKRW